MKINIDCSYYLGNKPCLLHKKDGRICDNCTDYSQIFGSILIVKLDALGDVLRSTAILPALKKKYPNFSVTWLTRQNAIPLLEGNININRLLTIEGNYLQLILNETFNIGICLDADQTSSTVLSLAKCEQKFGFICDASGSVLPANIEAEDWYLMGLNDELKKKNRKTNNQIIHDICKLEFESINSKPQFILNSKSEEFARAFLKKNNLQGFSTILGINTGGGNRWECKKWILDYYIELIRKIKNYNSKIGILLFGGPQEVNFNKEILEKVGYLTTDAGCSNTISDFASLINLCNIFFTPDSLGMHLSISLNKTTFVVVGPTSPYELDVYDNGEIIYNNEIKCLACYNSKCIYNKECMLSLTPDLIFTKIKRYLG